MRRSRAAISPDVLGHVLVDRAGGSSTLAVRLGQRCAVQMATWLTAAATTLTGMPVCGATLPASPIVG